MRRAAATVLLLLAAGCGRKPQVTSFMDVPFGATRQQLLARLGTPQSETPWSGGANSITFAPRTVLDDPAQPHFVVTRDGMVQGGYTVYVVEFEARCQIVYHQYVDAVKTRFPRLEPKEEHEGEAVDAPGFCAAAEDGRAAARTEWTDPANGARVTVAIWRGEHVLRVAYQSQAGREWSRATSDSMLKKDF